MTFQIYFSERKSVLKMAHLTTGPVMVLRWRLEVEHTQHKTQNKGLSGFRLEDRKRHRSRWATTGVDKRQQSDCDVKINTNNCFLHILSDLPRIQHTAACSCE